MGRKVEIIEINLDIDIDEEIKKKVDSLKTDIVIHTQNILDRAKLRKLKATGQKAKKAKERDSKLAKAVEYLETVFDHCGPDTDGSWVEGKKLLDVAGIEQTTQNLNKFSMQIRKFLTKNDKWVLLGKRKSRKTVYRLQRFS